MEYFSNQKLHKWFYIKSHDVCAYRLWSLYNWYLDGFEAAFYTEAPKILDLLKHDFQFVSVYLWNIALTASNKAVIVILMRFEN